MAKRQGRKSAAQTPAPPKERIFGSKKNPKGSASSEKTASKIQLSAQIIKTLEKKLKEFREKYPSKKNVTLADLKAVFRRGAGAYSKSHRPFITGGVPNSRNAWAFARVNKFLKKAGGQKVKAAYVQDDDLLKREGGGEVYAKGGNVIYTAIFFDENEIIKRYGQNHPNLFSHHSTIEFKPQSIDNLPIGDRVEVSIVGRLTTPKVDVLLVENLYSKNKYPHITLSTAEGVKPFESNKEIEQNLDKVEPLNDYISGVIGYFDGTNDVTKFSKGGQTFNDKELLAKYKRGESIGFTAIAHLKAKGLIPRADGTKRKSDKYLAQGGDTDTFEKRFGKEVFVQLTRKDLDDFAPELLELIKTAYGNKGGHPEFINVNDFKNSELNYWIGIDVDDDPDADALIGGKTTDAGTKITVGGQDGSKIGKINMIRKMKELLTQKGFYAEMDDELAEKIGAKRITDLNLIKRVLSKFDINYLGDGVYERSISGKVKEKVLVGIPNKFAEGGEVKLVYASYNINYDSLPKIFDDGSIPSELGEPHIFLIEGNKIIGCLFLNDDIYYDETSDYEFDIVIKEDKRGKGYAKLLLDEMINDFVLNFKKSKYIQANVVNDDLLKYLIKRYGFDCEEATWSNKIENLCILSRKKAIEYLKYNKNTSINFAKGGEIDPKILRERWAKKKDALENLANNIQRLRTNLSKDLREGDDKERLTALVVKVMDETGERVGNDVSADNGHFGVTGLKNKHIKVNGSNLKFKYTGKSGVEHEKEINDSTLANAMREAIKNSPSEYVFETSDGFRIKNDRVNRYLNRFDVSAKDLRGYSANKWIITRLKSVKDREILGDAKKRKTKFNEIVKDVAEKVGHGRATLKKHYLLPSLEREFINHGKIVDLSNIKRTYEDGGEVNSLRSAKQQFATDLQTDKDFQEAKKRAIYDERGRTFGTPNVLINDPYVRKARYKHFKIDDSDINDDDMEFDKGGILKRLAPGFYEGNYKGVKFTITQQEENAYGGKPMWYFQIENGSVDDLFFTKAQTLEAVKYFIDNPSKFARGGDTHDEINTGFDALANLETEPLNELVDIPNDGLGIYNKGGKTQYSDGVSKLVNKESIEHIIPTFEEDDINWFKLIHSKDLINQLLENIGIPIKVKYELGEGSYGTAWMTENDTVLKLTKNGAEAYSSYIIFKNQENFRSQAEIYNIFIINDYSKVDVQRIYFIEKQFLNPFQDSKASSISHIYNDIEATATATKYSNNDRLEMLENIIRDENLSDQESIYARQVFALAKDVDKEARAYGINLGDNHTGNVGFDNSGKLLCYDCAHVGNKKLKTGGNLKNDNMETMKVGGVLNKTTEKSAIPTFVDFDIKGFSYRNIPAINKILKKLKVNIQVTKILGEGASGVAFLTNRNTVLKVTSNGEEGYVSYVIMKNQNDFKSQSKIYNVFIVFGMGEPTFFIEKEKGEVMRDSKKYSQFMDTNWRNFKEIGEDSTLYKKREKLIDADIDDYREAGLKVSQNDKKYALQLVDLFHNIEIDMKKNGVNLEDSHDGNVGFFNGKILCFDCAYRNPKSIDLGRLVDSSRSDSSSDSSDSDSSSDSNSSRWETFATGGQVTQEEKKEIYAKWKKLVNMSKSELQKFYDSEEGKQAGLTPEEAKAEGIDSGRESARWVMKMKDTKVADWTPTMWMWAKKQISFVSRMSGNKGKLVDENGKKTRKYLSLLIWGNDPNKKAGGGDIDEPCHVCSMNDAQYQNLPALGEMADGKRFVYRESVFAKGGDTMSHVGDRYLILECMGEGGITDTLNLKVIQSSSPALLVGSIINRPIRNIINKGREMGTTFGQNIVGSYKKGGELNPDNKSVKNYFEHKSGSAGGLLVGKRHSEGGIKAINNSTGQPLEMEGGEVVITRDAVSDPTPVEFEGKKMTKREVLSEINQSGGGVAFADGGVVGEKNA